MMGKRFLSTLVFAFVAITISTHYASASSHYDAPVGSRRSAAAKVPWNKQFDVSSLEKSSDSPTTRGGAIDAPNELVSAASLFAIDYGIRNAFQACDISFPSQLGGCILLFAFLLLADFAKGGLGNDMLTFLSPGAGLLAKWLPVFFVPGLAMLPRAPSLGSALDVCLVELLGMIHASFCSSFCFCCLSVTDF